MSAIGPDDLSFVDGYLYRAMFDMLRADGADASGFYDYYRVRVEDGRHSLSDYDRMLFDHITRHFDRNDRRIVHAGIGLGTLTSLLAGGGYRVVGIEKDSARFRGAGRLRAALLEAWPEAAPRYELIAGEYPEAVSGASRLSASTLLIFTNCAAGWSDELTTSIIDSFARVGDVILDVRLFGVVRNEQKDRQALVERIESRGFEAHALEHQPGDGHYHHVRPRR